MTEESANDIVTHFSLSACLQVHDMGFDISIGDDPLFGTDVYAEAGPMTAPTCASAHKPSPTPDDDEAVWREILTNNGSNLSSQYNTTVAQ